MKHNQKPSQKEIVNARKIFASEIERSLLKYKKIVIPHVGTFRVAPKRKGVINCGFGGQKKTFQIPKGKRVVFKSSEYLLNVLNK